MLFLILLCAVVCEDGALRLVGNVSQESIGSMGSGEGVLEDGALYPMGTESDGSGESMGSGEGVMEYVVMRGRVEMCWEEVWGTVCDQSWTATDAAVVCRVLGFSQPGERKVNNYYI